jgi:biopolymer transport protein ExbD
MGFQKYRQRRSELPEINLVPMMDVLMTVLTFFIIIAMTLTGEQIANITLPNAKGSPSADAPPPQRLVIGLNAQGQVNIDRQIVSNPEVTAKIQTFLRQNPQGQIVLKADRQINYRYVQNTIKMLQSAGGDRLFLAINPSN